MYVLIRWSIFNFKKVPLRIHMLFLIPFALMFGFCMKAVYDDYAHDIYMNDHGVKAQALVLRKYSSKSSGGYVASYSFEVTNAGRTKLITHERDISTDTFNSLRVGDKTPIIYNPASPEDSHLDSPTYRASGAARYHDLEVYTYEFFIYSFGFTLILWLIICPIYIGTVLKERWFPLQILSPAVRRRLQPVDLAGN